MPSPTLVIRPTQMALLADQVDQTFLDGLVEQFARLYPDIAGIRDRITAIMSRAHRYGIRGQDDIGWFVGLDFARGHEWEQLPGMEWALDILDNPRVDMAGRRFRLEKWMRKWDSNGV